MTKNRPSVWLIFSLTVLVISGILLLFIWKMIPPEIPWFYSLPWGESQLMPKIGLPIVLGFGAIILYCGNLLSHWTKKGDKIIEQTVMITLMLVCLMLVVNIAKVLFIFI